MSKEVLITGKTFHPKFLELLQGSGYEVEYHPEDLKEESLIAAIKDKEAFILGGCEFASARVLASANRLKVIAVTAVGYQTYVDEAAAAKKGVIVTNTPSVNSRATAEMTIGLMLGLKRKICYVNRLAKAGRWRDEIIASSLYQETLGIIGMGEIGSIVAEIAQRSFRMNILYYSRSPKPTVERRLKAKRVSLTRLLKDSDVVSLHVPLTDRTKELLGAEQLRLMKSSAVLINTARPHVVSPKALLAALTEGLIAGCAMDGYYCEPAPASDEDPFGLMMLSDEKFLISPHIAYLTEDSIYSMCGLATQSVMQILAGKHWDYIVIPRPAASF